MKDAAMNTSVSNFSLECNLEIPNHVGIRTDLSQKRHNLELHSVIKRSQLLSLLTISRVVVNNLRIQYQE